ncbi:MAG: hypothetical protein LJE84_09735 [Gammaproteobacteria bacterium]|nr:hypothetical protein [Gammaproteobacteria bacterium]
MKRAAGWFTAACLRVPVRIAGWLPWRGVQLLGRVAGTIGRTLPNPLRSMARNNLRLVFPAQREVEIRKTAGEAVGHCLCTLLESGPLAYWSAERIVEKVREVHGEQLLSPPPSAGVLLVVPHLGNWELAGLYAGRRHPLSALYRPPRVVALEDWLRQRRQRFGTRLLSVNSSSDLRGAWRDLRNGRTVAVLPDQDPGRRRAGEWLPFFGLPTRTSTLAARLSRNAGRTVLGFSTRLANGQGFALHFETIDFEDGAGTAQRAAAINHAIESAVAPRLAQYQWCYDRWRPQRAVRSEATGSSGAVRGGWQNER